MKAVLRPIWSDRITVQDANDVIMQALGGAEATTTVEGRERYSVNLRYGHQHRTSLRAP